MTRPDHARSVPVLAIAIVLAMAAVMVAPMAARAQGRITATPLSPPDPQAEPPAEMTPAPPVITGRAPGFPNVWQPRRTATIQALDKVNARHALLTLAPGKPETFQSLTITLQSCVVRPPDQPADAAAYVTVTDSRGTDSRGDVTGFMGWLIRSSPATSMMQHPIYDLRVLGCGT